MTNKRIRKALFESEVRQWELAKKLGITETSLSRKLREELPREEQRQILKVIQELANDEAKH